MEGDGEGAVPRGSCAQGRGRGSHPGPNLPEPLGGAPRLPRPALAERGDSSPGGGAGDRSPGGGAGAGACLAVYQVLWDRSALSSDFGPRRLGASTPSPLVLCVKPPLLVFPLATFLM